MESQLHMFALIAGVGENNVFPVSLQRAAPRLKGRDAEPRGNLGQLKQLGGKMPAQ